MGYVITMEEALALIEPTKKRNLEARKVTLSVWASVTTVAQLDKLATKQGITRSQVASKLLEWALLEAERRGVLND